ncbi:MAG: hypothetical protein V4760_14315, partial [Bdellovibrionota bacterium]
MQKPSSCNVPASIGVTHLEDLATITMKRTALVFREHPSALDFDEMLEKIRRSFPLGPGGFDGA